MLFQLGISWCENFVILLQSYHFDQDDHYLPGFSKFFKKMAEEEHEHAQMVRLYHRITT
jgi:ferritin